MKIAPSSSQPTTNWSGGTTTELFIFPENSDYQKRNFDFRISTATVEIETSDFTPLMGVNRTLMVLEGEMHLSHEGQHSSGLKAFDQDRFDGGWQTMSRGKCVDLNLMCRGESTGKLQHFSIMKNSIERLHVEGQRSFIYFYRGGGAINELNYDPRDFVVVENEPSIKVTAYDQTDLVLITIL